MMSESPARRLAHERRMLTGAAFVLATTVRMAFAFSFPTIHGGDAAGRLARADTLVLGYQLPLPQAFVVLTKALHDDPLWVRLVFCLWGGALAAGVTALLGLTFGSRAALFGSLLLAFDPLLVHYSVVPYQEPVAYGLLAWAFYFAASHRAGRGAIFMAAACLSRYEAWAFLPAFFRVSNSKTATLWASLPTVGWMFWWQGLGPRGLYVLDLDREANRLSRISFLAGKFLEYETVWVVALGAVALAVRGVRGGKLAWKFSVVMAAAVGLVVVLGHEHPPGSGLMSERLIHLPVLLLVPLAALTLAWLSSTSRTARVLSLSATLLFAGRNLHFERELLRAAARDPDLALARDVALAIESNRRPGECVSVRSLAVGTASLEAYVAKVGASFGDVERARERASMLATASPDRDRIAAHLRAPAGTVRGAHGCSLLVLVDDLAFGPEEGGASYSLVARISAGPRQASVLRILQ